MKSTLQPKIFFVSAVVWVVLIFSAPVGENQLMSVSKSNSTVIGQKAF